MSKQINPNQIPMVVRTERRISMAAAGFPSLDAQWCREQRCPMISGERAEANYVAETLAEMIENDQLVLSTLLQADLRLLHYLGFVINHQRPNKGRRSYNHTGEVDDVIDRARVRVVCLKDEVLVKAGHLAMPLEQLGVAESRGSASFLGEAPITFDMRKRVRLRGELNLPLPAAFSLLSYCGHPGRRFSDAPALVREIPPAGCSLSVLKANVKSEIEDYVPQPAPAVYEPPVMAGSQPPPLPSDPAPEVA